MKKIVCYLKFVFSNTTLVLLFLSISVISCGNSGIASNQDQAIVKKSNANETTDKATSSNTGDPITDIEKAKKNGQVVFIVITGKTATGVESAEKIAKEASVKIKNSVIVKIDRDNAANKNLVTKFGVGSVQLPFILVVSPKGIAVGGYPSSQATSDLLVKAIPSPKQDEALFAVSQNQPVFIVVSKSGLADKSGIIANCKTASEKLAPKAIIIEIDFADTKETAFLKIIGVKEITGQTITVVANGKGEITDTFNGIVSADALVTSVKKIIKSGGCCPAGSGKKC